MRNAASLIVPFALLVSACSSSDGTTEVKQTPVTKDEPANTATGFTPPKLEDGFTRLEAMTVTDIKPGADTTRCQYMMPPFEQDMDVLDVIGGQSPLGHHLVAFTYTPKDGDVVGAEVPCMMGSSEFSAGDGSGSSSLTAGGYLGAASPVSGRAAPLPEGVAYRLKKGDGVVLNMHYINTSEDVGNGDAYIDLKFVDVDPNRLIASLFVNVNGSFNVPPNAKADSSMDCVAGSDVKFIMMSNHMHEWGTEATTQVTRGEGGAVDVMRRDATWSEDMVNAPTFARWTVEDPFVLHAGDTISTSCTWSNTTAKPLDFPREMCISAGFALAQGSSPKVPSCFNGSWIDQGL